MATSKSEKLNLAGKKILVMGLGLHNGGLGVTKFLVEQGAIVTVTDLRSPEILAPSLKQLENLPVNFVLGEHREQDFREADVVIKNPAVRNESGYLKIAREAGAAIEMELTLFFKLCPSPFTFGITGTRGKTTTTLMLGAMMRQWRPDTVIAGNLRTSALTQLPQIGPDTPVVLELSSWQLEGLGEQHLSPSYAAVTNMSPDHLDRYGSMEEYAAAKQNICKWQHSGDIVVLNAEDSIVNRFSEVAGGKVGWFASQPLTPGDFGTYLDENNDIYWQDATGYEEKIGPASIVQLSGKHNLTNALAAIALAKVGGVPTEAIVHALQNFKGVPDRMETIRELGGVIYINDTTSTSPAGTVAALEALHSRVEAAKRSNIVLLAGGADKQLEFEPMVAAIANPANGVKQIIMLKGSATARLSEALRQAGFTNLTEPYDNFGAAVEAAREVATNGDTVLLSPGCASFGMFTHEFDRGQQFRDIVNKL